MQVGERLVNSKQFNMAEKENVHRELQEGVQKPGKIQGRNI